MGGFSAIFRELVGGDPVKGISDLIDQFHLSPEQKAALEQQAQQLELQREQIAAARDQAVTAIQGQNIRAETTSSDAYVRRARPTFLYLMYLCMLFSLIVAPAISEAQGHGFQIMQIPDAYLQLFGVAFLGYVGARSWDKKNGTQTK